MRNMIGNEHGRASWFHGARSAPDLPANEWTQQTTSQIPGSTIAPTPHRSLYSQSERGLIAKHPNIGPTSYLRQYRLASASGIRNLIYNRCALLIGALACIAFSSCQTSTTALSENPATAPTDKNAGRLAVDRAANLGEDLLLSIVDMKLSPLRKDEIYSGPLSPATCFVRSSGTESIESSSNSKLFDGQTWPGLRIYRDVAKRDPGPAVTRLQNRQRGAGVTLGSL